MAYKSTAPRSPTPIPAMAIPNISPLSRGDATRKTIPATSRHTPVINAAAVRQSTTAMIPKIREEIPVMAPSPAPPIPRITGKAAMIRTIHKTSFSPLLVHGFFSSRTVS